MRIGQQYLYGVFALFLMSMIFCVQVKSSTAMSIIRDTEIETTLRGWMKPIFKAAGMNAEDVRIILVGSSEVNAFVAGGRNIFIYTGLILEAEKASEVIGVMAHELGHIQGGHLVRMREELEMASYQSMLAGVLGIGVAAIGGQAELGTAIYTGGSGVAGRNFLSFSRTQESAADQAALRYFSLAGMSPQGLVSFMRKLEGQELLSSQYQNQYMRTHPVTRDRVKAMEAGLKRSIHANKEMPSNWQEGFERIKAKIQSYMEPSYALGVYGGQYKTVKGKYALSIVDYRQGRLDDALKKINELIMVEPENPYFYEFKGQILQEKGKFDESIEAYKKALSLAPHANLMRIDLAQSYLGKSASAKGRDDLLEAKTQLLKAQATENKTARLHRLLATIHGRLGFDGRAQLSLAEEALMLGKYKDANMFAERAKMALKKKSEKLSSENRRAWLRAQDIIQYVSNKKD
jgi:predicted Zn-dependent protease